jgi:steroid delta-isomerase-like uncharacterized protein
MSDAKKLSRRIFEEVWNNRNLAAIDELLAANYVHHDPQTPQFPNGPEGYKLLVSHYLKAFPDCHFAIDQELQDGNVAVTHWTVSGTHRGDLPVLAATGKTFSVSGISIARATDGKLVESWNIWDALGMMQQLGGISAAAVRAA